MSAFDETKNKPEFNENESGNEDVFNAIDRALYELEMGFTDALSTDPTNLSGRPISPSSIHTIGIALAASPLIPAPEEETVEAG